MDLRLYTDEKYIPISQMSAFDQDLITQIKKYRGQFNQMIQIDELSFVNLIETPDLIKKRFIKNIEIKDRWLEPIVDNDFILRLAIAFINKQKLRGVTITDNNELLKTYKKNNNDLTIITTYIINHINDESFIKWEIKNNKQVKLKTIIPEISNYELEFVKKYNKQNHSYILNDFIELNHTSYETARKSLEKLKELDLYTRNKVGKKYVYVPTKKLINILKRGI